jgi:hypothetical protein
VETRLLRHLAAALRLRSMNFIKIGGRMINIDHIAQVTRTKNAVGECVAIHLTDCGGTGTIVHQLEGKGQVVGQVENLEFSEPYCRLS